MAVALSAALLAGVAGAQATHPANNAATGERISQAEVQATVALLGGSGVTKRLQPMTVADQASFGGFFSMTPRGVYRIRFEVKRPDRPNAVAEFEYRVPG